jgi:lipoate-protein ligase A
MAVDHALLDLADGEGAAFFRLYQWQPHCLSFGRHEPALHRYDVLRIRSLGLDCVRRPTGGRAVWHARELTYAVAAPLAAFGGLANAYTAIHAMFVTALQSLGVVATLAPRPAKITGVDSGPCFAAPVGGEVLLGGRKVLGSAQLCRRSAFLQHGSLLLEDDQALVRTLATLPATAPAEATVSGTLGRPVTFAEAAQSVGEVADALLPDPAWLLALPPEVESAAARHADHYRSAAWTWER